MTTVVKILIRVAAFALALTGYMELIVSRWGEEGDANIGAGLLAFLLLAVAGFCWALYDGRRDGIGATVICWGVVSAVFSLGWLVVMALSEADESMNVKEMIATDAALIPFTFTLVFIPAVIGAAIGNATRSTQSS
ncbi:hypothetical protein [Nocardioides sp. InS609-2]|uniref:hypothetical protein n=1 Tax=Nocardioides sp. InS609-2 TaxID=2760705 RepID=UPI0020C008BB|nr:hypothetical protein [Nocardioides sp. InS609-2]